ncbi:endonuclease III [SAR202 cluster bacterium AC-647-N09_OGT_505m]|nr:endonuclease III [SAR202 cluster bacterium AC-647-N09_OGT_505m]
MPSSRGNPVAVTSAGSFHNKRQMPLLEAYHLLQREQGVAEWIPRYNGVSELLFTILSQHTSDLNALRSFESLRNSLGTWEQVVQANPKIIADAIWMGGLSNVKAPRIKAVLQEIQEQRGNLDLSFLKGMPLPEAKAWLRNLPGVGPKTAAIVLCFAMGMPAMPVDTHIYRVSKRLGFIGPKTTADQAHDLLEAAIDSDKVFAFHVYLITHGRQVCKARRPLCHECVLNKGCPSAFQV